MPNWCENELTITGPDVQKVLDAIRSNGVEDQDARILDFDRIIPYPKQYKELDQCAHEYQQKRFAIGNDDPDRNTKLDVLAAEYGVEPGIPWLMDGFNSGGYEWRIDNWNTKWNATGVSLTTGNNSMDHACKQVQCSYCQTTHNIEHMTVLVCKQCGSPLPNTQPLLARLEFNTAWSPPIPVIEKLAGMFPDHFFELQYFEGGIGFCGHVCWEHGNEQYHNQGDYNGPRGG